MISVLAVIVGAATTVSGFSSEVAAGVDPSEQIVLEFERAALPPWIKRPTAQSVGRRQAGNSTPAAKTGSTSKQKRSGARGRPGARAANRAGIPPQQVLPLSPGQARGPAAKSAPAVTAGGRPAFAGELGRKGKRAQPPAGEGQDRKKKPTQGGTGKASPTGGDEGGSAGGFRPPERMRGWNYVLHGR